MNALDLWIHSPGARALGWTLFHFLWEGAAIAGILVLALAVLKHAFARARYAAACAALLGMALAFGITLGVEWPWHAGRLTIATDGLAGLNVGGVFADSGRAPGFRWSDGLAWAPALWLAGVCGLFLYRLGSWIAAQRLRRIGTFSAPDECQQRLRALAGAMGVAGKVALLESCLAEVPIMIGYLKPVIVTPIGLLMGLPVAQVEAILLHELAHIRRADYLINLAQTAVEGLLFYHPAVWWVSGVVRAERENCCDDAVVALQGNVHQYAAALFTVEQQRSRVPVAALAATGGSLARRIRRLLGKPDARDLSLPVLPSALLLVSVAVALAAWQPVRPQKPVQPVAAVQPMAPEPASAAVDPLQPQEPAASQAPAAPQQAAPLYAPVRAAAAAQDVTYTITDEERAAFLRQQEPDGSPWPAALRQFLNDTSVIIAPRERTAYLKLQTDEEREKFIEQFWARRNPTPGAATNSFRDEFYRRLAYADAKFSTASGDRTVAGSHTALGRTYVKYGPPDQIEDHTSDPQSPSLLWRYNYLEAFHSNAEFQFVKVGANYREQINWPPPVATFQGVPGAADNLAAALNSERRLQGQPVMQAQSLTPGLPGNHATIQISPDKPLVILTVPLGSLSGSVDFIGEIRVVSSAGVTGSTAASVRDYIQTANGGNWQSQFTLAPGAYVCRLVVRENATGQIFTEVINFEVP
jgi:GWxTD domain-containing protein